MTRIERWGMELATAIRSAHDLQVELDAANRAIDVLIEQIRTEPDGTLHESTSEQPLVRPYVEDAGETLRMVFDDDRTVASVGMSPIVPCPGGDYRFGEETCEMAGQRRHAHTADGKTHVLPEVR